MGGGSSKDDDAPKQLPFNWCERCRQSDTYCDELMQYLVKKKDQSGVSKFIGVVASFFPGVAPMAKAVGIIGDSGGGGGSPTGNMPLYCPPLPKAVTLPPTRIPMTHAPVTAASAGTKASLSAGAIAGIAVGGVFLLLILCGVFVVLICWINKSPGNQGGAPGGGGCEAANKANGPSINIANKPVVMLKKRSSYKGAVSKRRSGNVSKKSSLGSKKSSLGRKRSSLGRKKSSKGSKKGIFLSKKGSQGRSRASSFASGRASSFASGRAASRASSRASGFSRKSTKGRSRASMRSSAF